MKIILKIFLTVSILAPLSLFAQGESTTPALLHTKQTARIPILIYHSVRPYYPGITKLVKEFTVPPDIFEEQLKYLKDNGYTVITLDDLINYFSTNISRLPAKPIIITLDDGWENQYRYAYPILKKDNVSALFYIYPGAINTKHFLTWEEVQTMSKDNMVIGDHTYSHPQLPKVIDAKALNREIVESKSVIEKNIGKAVKDFAYPFGEYNNKDVELVRQAGYQSARTVYSGTLQTEDILFTLRGIIVTGDFNRFVSSLKK